MLGSVYDHRTVESLILAARAAEILYIEDFCSRSTAPSTKSCLRREAAQTSFLCGVVLCKQKSSLSWISVWRYLESPKPLSNCTANCTSSGCQNEALHSSNNRNTVILINSHSKIHVIFTSTAEWLLFRMTVMEKTQLDHAVSKKMHILELAAALPPPTPWYKWFLILYGPVVSSP